MRDFILVPHKRHRIVSQIPPVSVYKPVGIPAKDLNEIEINLNEFEAFRLAYFKDLSQRKASALMQTSQSTFNRILSSARHKIARCLVLGCTLRIKCDTDNKESQQS